MNNDRRKELSRLSVQIEEIKDSLESLKCEEEEYLENMPENFQDSERGERASEAINNIDSALSALGEAISCMESARE
nr:hypothetical protein [uncultured Oscillibacter sp.]